MGAPTIVNHDLGDGLIATGEFESQVLTLDVSGTRGSVVDTTSYPVTDQDTLTALFTVDGGAQQTVTFSGAHTTALQIAASINDQLVGASAVVTGGQVVVTSDSGGSSSSVAAAAGTGGLTWDTPVAGTGNSGVVKDNTLLALNTSTLKMVPYVKGGSTNGNGVVYGALLSGFTATASGDTPIRVATGPGLKMLKSKTVIDADGDASNIDNAVKLLCLDKGINLVESTNLHVADNS